MKIYLVDMPDNSTYYLVESDKQRVIKYNRGAKNIRAVEEIPENINHISLYYLRRNHVTER